jgi:membrane-bound metal-dependent hydrolase YbcI (DUF457 family)
LSNFIHIITGHREEFHSLLFSVSLSLIVLLIFRNILFSGIFFLFYFLHLLLDSFTKSGIRWLWPSKFRIKGNITTGRFLESIVFLIFALASVILILIMI